MSLPIDTEAIAAQAKAEHEYGERLMDLAEWYAKAYGRQSVTAADVQMAAEATLMMLDEDAAFRASEPIPDLAGQTAAVARAMHEAICNKVADEVTLASIGPQRATPASPAQLHAQADQLRCICAERLGVK